MTSVAAADRGYDEERADASSINAGTTAVATSPGAAEDEPFFAGFSIGKMLLCAAIGLSAGAAYSVFDQTVLHRKKKTIPLPFAVDAVFREQCPDIVARLEEFHQHRSLVVGERGQAEFDRILSLVIEQCGYFAAVYNMVMNTSSVHPNEMREHARLKFQAKEHFAVINKHLRSLLVLIGRPDDMNVEHSFNMLYEAFMNRFYIMHQKALG